MTRESDGWTSDQVAVPGSGSGGRATFRAGAVLERLQRGPGSPGVVAKRDLQRYYDLVDECIADLGLSESEAALFTEAAAGFQDVGESVRAEVHKYLWAEVEEAIRARDLDAKWEVDEPHELVERVRSLSPAASRALVDVLERFWALDPAEPLPERLREVGLVLVGGDSAR